MKEKVYDYLNKLNIEFKIYHHPALYTCADGDKYGLEFDGMKDKNLFLRNRNKSKYYLVTMPESKALDLKTLALKLEETKLSFANEDELFSKLKIKPGTVSILNIIEAEQTVVFIIDEDLLKAEKICAHPNDNTITITFKSKAIEKILQGFANEYRFIRI